MKKVLVLVLMMVMSLSLIGCNDAPTPQEAPAAATPAAPTPAPAATPAEPAAPAVDAATDNPLAGRWYWMGTLYYALDYDGEGTMAGAAIRWTSADGILAICTTPDSCGTTCLAPMEWYYVLEGAELTLTSTIIDNMVFTYTRR